MSTVMSKAAYSDEWTPVAELSSNTGIAEHKLLSWVENYWQVDEHFVCDNDRILVNEEAFTRWAMDPAEKVKNEKAKKEQKERATRPAREIDTKPTALYRHFDECGNLLYVGISVSALARLAGHRASGWWDSIAQITIERHPSRSAAEDAEKIAIKSEKPIHNKAHNNG